MKKILLIILIAIGVALLWPIKMANVDEAIAYEFYEDVNANLSIETIKKIYNQGDFQKHQSNAFSFGIKEAAYWIAIPSETLNKEDCLSIYNPTVKEVSFYASKSAQEGYEPYYNGWRNNKINGKRFLYPILELTEMEIEGDVAFLRLSSPYTQNYVINLLSEETYEHMYTVITLLSGLLLGILLTMVIQNAVLAIRTKSRSYDFFLIYVVVMIVYEMALTGMANLYFPNSKFWLMDNILWLSVFSGIAFVMYVKNVIRERASKQYNQKVFKWITRTFIMGMALILIHQYTLANIYYHSIMTLAALSLLYMIYKRCKQGNYDLYHLFYITLVMLCALLISLLRSSGYLPNNFVTVNAVLIAVFIQAILMIGDMQRFIRLAEEKKTYFKNAFLNTQIKPHFIFNALNVIAYLCKKDGNRASELMMDLAVFLRYSFDTSIRVSKVTLQEELKIVEAYLRIEQARFDNKIEVHYHIDPTVTVYVPVLSIQPLVENAIKHGIRKKEEGGRIDISLESTGDYHWIKVRDNGVGIEEHQLMDLKQFQLSEARGVALFNIHNRLEEAYGRGLNIESQLGDGTTVSFYVREEGLC